MMHQRSTSAAAGALLLFGLAVFADSPPPPPSNPLVDASAALAGFERMGAIDFPNLAVGSDGLGGAAWLDYDNDLDLDLFIGNGTGHPGALFRNNGDGSFTDVAAAAGLASDVGTSGTLAGDVNNDGCTDLLLTGDGGMLNLVEAPARLMINDCSGAFDDRTADFGLASTVPAFGAAFGDINDDGFLDLFITGLGGFRPPTAGNKSRNQLLLNVGGTSFVDISITAGIDDDLGACVVDFTDFDEDGWTDIFVGNCNDFTWLPAFRLVPGPFQIFRNNGDLTFTNVSLAAGLPRPGFWMTASHGDYDNDGDLDFFGTNLGTITPFTHHALYNNNGDGTYTDVGPALGVSAWEFGWGTSFFDAENDGDQDVIMVGSLPQEPFRIGGPGRANPGRLFISEGFGCDGDSDSDSDSEDSDVAPPVAPGYTMIAEFGLENDYSSGLAVADYDGDGFEDVVIVRHQFAGGSGEPVLLRNQANGNHWLTVRLEGNDSNRQGVGALVRVSADGCSQVKEVQAGSSTASTSSPWPTFGLRDSDEADVEVTWPSGLVEEFEDISTNRLVTLMEGDGDSDSDSDSD